MSTPSTLFTDILTRFEATGADAAATHYVLSLGAANATTGAYAETYAAGVSIHMPIFSKATQHLLIGTGFYVRKGLLGFTDTAVTEGNKIKDAGNLYYKILAVRPHHWGDIIVLYECDLEYNPFNY